MIGVWVYVVVIYDFSIGNVFLYINGYLSNLYCVFVGLYIVINVDKVWIGVIKGVIVEMKVYDVVLKEVEI